MESNVLDLELMRSTQTYDIESKEKAVLPSNRKHYNLLADIMSAMSDHKRTMPVCFTRDQLRMVEEYAKKRGMLNPSQAIEELTK